MYGIPVGGVRLPLVPLNDAENKMLQETLQLLNVKELAS
jgi:4-hydroxy-tetrahydrodipicolinate synthase